MLKLTCLIVLALVLLVSVFSGCGQGGEVSKSIESHQGEPATSGASGGSAEREKPTSPTYLSVSLDGYEGAENISLVMAADHGFFTDEGLTVRLVFPHRPRRPMRYLEERLDQFVVAQQPQVVIAKGKGVPVVALGSVISRPTAAMISLRKSGIGSIRDLKGKTIAMTGVPFQERFLEVALAQAGLPQGDVKVETVDYESVPALLSGRADVIFGGERNLELAELRKRGAHPIVVPFEDLGFPGFEELEVVARENFVAEEPETVRKFMSAVERGTAAALRNPDGAVETLVNAGQLDPRLRKLGKLGRRVLEAQARATLPLLSIDGAMDTARTEELAEWMQGQAMTPQLVPAASLLNEDFLPPGP
jgi:putative hydroxymethylpyrimidine transport system substrate-binding protein